MIKNNDWNILLSTKSQNAQKKANLSDLQPLLNNNKILFEKNMVNTNIGKMILGESPWNLSHIGKILLVLCVMFNRDTGF